MFAPAQKPVDSHCVLLAVNNLLAWRDITLPPDVRDDIDIMLASSGEGIIPSLYQAAFEMLGLKRTAKDLCTQGAIVIHRGHAYLALLKTEYGWFCLNRDGRHGWFTDIEGEFYA